MTSLWGLKDADKTLEQLRYHFGTLANTHMRYARPKEQVKLTEANIAMGRQRYEHLVERWLHLYSFTNPSSAA
jgi:hypothetical protein